MKKTNNFSVKEGKAKRRTPQELTEQARQAESMLQQGYSVQEVARQTGLSMQKVTETKLAAYETGRLRLDGADATIVRADTRFCRVIVSLLKADANVFLRIERVSDGVSVRVAAEHPEHASKNANSAKEVEHVQ